jgi:single-strand DNA-binding protein
MASYQLTGKLHEIFEVRQVTDNFRTREFVIETVDSQYKEFVKLQSVQDRVHLIDTFKVGDMVMVSFDLRGRPYTTRDGSTNYITNLNAWRIEYANAAPQQGYPQQGGAGAPPQFVQPQPGNAQNSGVSYDLPKNDPGHQSVDDLPF